MTARSARAARPRPADEIESLLALPDDPAEGPTDAPYWLACAVCGVAVVDVVVTEAKDVTVTSPTGARQTERMVDLGLCEACQGDAGQVRAIVASHPAAISALGPAGAERAVSNVLAAFAVLSVAAPAAAASDADLAALIRHLSAPGASVPYRRRVTRPGQCAPQRFAEVPPWVSEQIRAAYALLLRERVARGAPPVAIPVPSTTRPGCLYCGVGTVAVAATTVAVRGHAAASSSVWFRRDALPRSSLGGRGTDPITGYLCPACDEAVESVGSVGTTSLVRALVAYLRTSGSEQLAASVEQADQDTALRGVAGWAVTGLPPNARPWAHLDLA